MEKKKPQLGSFVRDGTFCVKCGSKIPYDDVGHKCELIPCPQPKKDSGKKKDGAQPEKEN